MQPRKSNAKADAVPENRNGFAGREVFAELFVKNDSRRDLRAEVEDEFRAFSGSGELGYFSRDERRIENDLKDALGVPVTVVMVPKPSFSQRQVERLSTELKKLAQTPLRKPESRKKPEPEAAPTVFDQVAEEFASLSAKTELTYSSASVERAERDLSAAAGVCLSVRPYSKSKKRDLQALENLPEIERK